MSAPGCNDADRGESESMGPVNDAIRKRMKAEQTDIKFEIE